MKVVGLVLLVAALCAIDERYLDGRNTTAVVDTFRSTVSVINHYADDLLAPLKRRG
jgi:hypothetical protein